MKRGPRGHGTHPHPTTHLGTRSGAGQWLHLTRVTSRPKQGPQPEAPGSLGSCAGASLGSRCRPPAFSAPRPSLLLLRPPPSVSGHPLTWGAIPGQGLCLPALPPHIWASQPPGYLCPRARLWACLSVCHLPGPVHPSVPSVGPSVHPSHPWACLSAHHLPGPVPPSITSLGLSSICHLPGPIICLSSLWARLSVTSPGPSIRPSPPWAHPSIPYVGPTGSPRLRLAENVREWGGAPWASRSPIPSVCPSIHLSRLLLQPAALPASPRAQRPQGPLGVSRC